MGLSGRPPLVGMGWSMTDTLTLDDLRGAPYNPRVITEAASDGLGASMKDLGDISGIVFNRRSGQLVAGHQRVERLRSMGGVMEGDLIYVGEGLDRLQFAVRVVDWDDAKERRGNVAANNPHIAGVFDDGLDALLDQIKAEGSEEFERLRLSELVTPPPAPPGPGATELTGADLGGQEHECPRCHFQF